MEDLVIVPSDNGPNHKSPLKKVDILQIKIDKLSLEIKDLKKEIEPLMDYIKENQIAQKKGYWW